MTEHTPGPWHVGSYPDRVVSASGYVVADVGGVHILDGRPDDAPHWSYEDGSARDLSEEEETANASLIAAAPDLLAALVRISESIAGDEGIVTTSMTRQARAAISKLARRATSGRTGLPTGGCTMTDKVTALNAYIDAIDAARDDARDAIIDAINEAYENARDAIDAAYAAYAAAYDAHDAIYATYGAARDAISAARDARDDACAASAAAINDAIDAAIDAAAATKEDAQ